MYRNQEQCLVKKTTFYKDIILIKITKDLLVYSEWFHYLENFISNIYSSNDDVGWLLQFDIVFFFQDFHVIYSLISFFSLKVIHIVKHNWIVFFFLLIKNHYYNYQVKLQYCISNVYKILNWVCLWWNNFIISYHIVDLSIMSFNSSFLIQIYTYHLLYYGAMYILEFFFSFMF